MLPFLTKIAPIPSDYGFWLWSKISFSEHLNVQRKCEKPYLILIYLIMKMQSAIMEL